MWQALLMALIGEAPSLLNDAESIFTNIAHGEGGVEKVAKVLGGLSHLTAAANSALSTVQKA